MGLGFLLVIAGSALATRPTRPAADGAPAVVQAEL
jgi:hypothetical protein